MCKPTGSALGLNLERNHGKLYVTLHRPFKLLLTIIPREHSRAAISSLVSELWKLTLPRQDPLCPPPPTFSPWIQLL